MRITSFALVIMLSVTMLIVTACKSGSCSGLSSSGDTAVAVAMRHVADSSSFVLSNGERCSIVATADIQFPSKVFAQGASLDSLKRLFARYVLDADASMPMDDALKQVVANSMHQYDFMAEPAQSQSDDNGESRSAVACTTNTRVAPVYNKNGVVTFERVDVVKRNGKVSSLTHRYFSFDVKAMAYIDLNRMFREDAIADVCQLLKQQLFAQNNADSNEQLNDLGFFNVENISVTRNFFFDDKGVTWSFLPNELAVEAIGEPRISISYDDLDDFLCDGSIIDSLN